MPRKGHKTLGPWSIPTEIVDAVKQLSTDPAYIREMKLKGYGRISQSLVARMALIAYLADRGNDIFRVSKATSK